VLLAAVQATLELLLATTTLDEEGFAELELGTTAELLGGGAMELLLCTATLDEEDFAELELRETDEELLKSLSFM